MANKKRTRNTKDNELSRLYMGYSKGSSRVKRSAQIGNLQAEIIVRKEIY